MLGFLRQHQPTNANGIARAATIALARAATVEVEVEVEVAFEVDPR
jgi:hypothetical protein